MSLRSFGYARLASSSRDEKSLASRNVAEKAACTFGNGRSGVPNARSGFTCRAAGCTYTSQYRWRTAFAGSDHDAPSLETNTAAAKHGAIVAASDGTLGRVARADPSAPGEGISGVRDAVDGFHVVRGCLGGATHAMVRASTNLARVVATG